MTSDPASINVEFVVSGLNRTEAAAFLGALPPGAHGVTVSPGGVPRYSFDVGGSVSGAASALRALEDHLLSVAGFKREEEPPPETPAASTATLWGQMTHNTVKPEELGPDPRYVRLTPQDKAPRMHLGSGPGDQLPHPYGSRICCYLEPQLENHMWNGEIHLKGTRPCCAPPTPTPPQRHDMYPDAPPLE